MQDRACADGRPIRDGDVRQHARAGPHHAAVSETRRTVERCGRMHSVERPDMDIMCDNATFVEKIEVTDHDIAGEHHTR